MFSITQGDRRRHSRTALRSFLLETFAENDEVWEIGTTRTLLVGNGEMDEDDAADAVYQGTVAEYAASLDDA